jgi:hypothetical protein
MSDKYCQIDVIGRLKNFFLKKRRLAGNLLLLFNKKPLNLPFGKARLLITRQIAQ